MHYTTTDILTGGRRDDQYRSHRWVENYDNMLVISQPSPASCVHVIDQHWPIYSKDDADQILVIGAASHIENILTDAVAPQLDETIFGSEPPHTWCYYFQKGSLAIQARDWQKAADLGDEAISLGYHPNDRVEWIPFLQANAILGNDEVFKAIAVKVKDDKFERLQACTVLNQMVDAGYTFSEGIHHLLSEYLCPATNQ